MRPGITRLEKIVATARSHAQTETFDRLEPLLTEERRRFLDQRLVPDVATSRTPLIWLRQTAASNSAIDIADLYAVHMRNVPPSPANYAQRSGRAGRGGRAALVVTYCAAGSGHDQYFFQRQERVVAGAVRPPQLMLDNEELVTAHVHALWLAHVGLKLGQSVAEVIEVTEEPKLPLSPEVQKQLKLSEKKFQECLEDAREVLASAGLGGNGEGYPSDEWLRLTLTRAPREFDRAFDRWRELYRSARRELQRASTAIADPHIDREARWEAGGVPGLATAPPGVTPCCYVSHRAHSWRAPARDWSPALLPSTAATPLIPSTVPTVAVAVVVIVHVRTEDEVETWSRNRVNANPVADAQAQWRNVAVALLLCNVGDLADSIPIHHHHGTLTGTHPHLGHAELRYVTASGLLLAANPLDIEVPVPPEPGLGVWRHSIRVGDPLENTRADRR